MGEERDALKTRQPAQRRWRAAGGAFANDFRPDANSGTFGPRYQNWDKQALAAQPRTVAVAGRVMLRRVMGKASFISLQGRRRTHSVLFEQADLGVDAYQGFKDQWDIGDIAGVRGRLMRTTKAN